jgi:hypothetical protein
MSPKIIRKKDEDALRQAESSLASVDISDMIELEKLRLLRELRTGRPVSGPTAPTGAKKPAKLDVTAMAEQVAEMKRAQEVIVEAADTIRPQENPMTTFFSSPMAQGIGQGLGQILAEVGRLGIRRLAERRQAPKEGQPTLPQAPTGPGVSGQGPQAPVVSPPQPAGLASGVSQSSGFIGAAEEPVKEAPERPMMPTANEEPPQKTAMEVRLSQEDKEAFARTQAMIQDLAKVVSDQGKRLERMERKSKRKEEKK